MGKYPTSIALFIVGIEWSLSLALNFLLGLKVNDILQYRSCSRERLDVRRVLCVSCYSIWFLASLGIDCFYRETRLKCGRIFEDRGFNLASLLVSFGYVAFFLLLGIG
ncbi:Hypothetical protein POVR1_LOCUS574 [uncultured virus]|nr:Hypothetical protein POVR1_LOCUS574 [uncultured virus]